MKFYDRESEVGLLREIELASRRAGQMSFIVGRRRSGKTTLIKESFKDNRLIYLFVSKKDEILLCEEFVSAIKASTELPVFGEFNRFKDLFAFLVEASKQFPLTLAIDEFQEFARINGSVYSDMQDIWDSNKSEARLNLVMSGSVFSLMKKIFEGEKEPLFGRADNRIHLKPFTADILKKIYREYCPEYKNEDILAFFMLTGGMAKYVEYFVDRKLFTAEAMLNAIFAPGSIFLEEGRNVLIEELGKEYGTYFSILSLIAAAKTSRSEIESVLEKNVGGYLDRLENDYCIIRKVRPIFAKPSSRAQKYFIDDNFLNFWFRYIYKYQSAIEIENFESLKQYVKADFRTYSGRFLEKYFVDKLIATREYTRIGTYWERGNRNEIDIVAVNEFNRRALVAEVKLNSDKVSLNELKFKARNLERHLSEYQIDYQGLSLADM